MMRRHFLQLTSVSGILGMVGVRAGAGMSEAAKENDREYWVALLDKIATPVLGNMSQGLLVKKMKVEVSPVYDKRDPRVAYMEAFGRLVSGLAPFLALPADNTAEGKIRKRLLPLGLPATDEFWSAPPAEWTQKKAWSGKPFKRDHAIDF